MKKLAAWVLALFLLGGCAAGTGELREVKVSEVAHSVFYAPQYVAMSQGFFEDEGLELTLLNGGGADKVMTSVLTGEVQIGLAGPEACLYVHLEGREDSPLVFAQLTNCDGSFVVGRAPEDFTWESLRGKTILGGRKGGVPEMTLEYVMKQNGIVPQQDAVVDTSVQFNMMAGAFTGGNGDYVTLFEPTATEVELAGQGYVLCSVGQESGDIPYTAYFALESVLEEQQELVQRFTNAIARGQKWVETHTDREVAEAIADQFPDTDVAVLEQVAARYRAIGAWKTEPTMEPEDFDRLMDVMEQAGELEARVDFGRFVTNRFAEQAK